MKPIALVTDDDSYSAAKAFAVKGTLLSAQAMQDLTESRNLEELAVKLKGTPYAESVSRVERPYSAAKLEFAFLEHLSATHFRLMRRSTNQQLAAYYMKYIARNLKTVLKGKAIGKAYDDLVKHVDLYPEELIGRRDLIVKALSAPDLNEAVKLLKESEFGDAVASASKSYEETGNVQVFDLYLDQVLYDDIRKSFREGEYEVRLVKPLVAIDIDSYNILAILRSKLWDLPVSEQRSLMVNPVTVKRDILDRMIAAPTVPDAMKYLQETNYRDIAPKGGADEAMVSQLEEAFTALTHTRAQYAFIWESGEIGVAIIKLLEAEIRHLSAIAFGVEVGAPPQTILAKIRGKAS